MKLPEFISQFHREESGQDMLEYALVLLAVLAAVVSGSTTLQSIISGELTAISTALGGLTLP
jgi:Flp pilus assembly pilin Flp